MWHSISFCSTGLQYATNCRLTLHFFLYLRSQKKLEFIPRKINFVHNQEKTSKFNYCSLKMLWMVWKIQILFNWKNIYLEPENNFKTSMFGDLDLYNIKTIIFTTEIIWKVDRFLWWRIFKFVNIIWKVHIDVNFVSQFTMECSFHVLQSYL